MEKYHHARRKRSFFCIDLKSFYASVECVDRGLDPFTTDLVVADPTRSKNTICLAVSPSLKGKGVRNRCRLREIPRDVHCIVARPRMHRYMEVSVRVYRCYLSFASPCDVYPYSIDECFIDAAPYLRLYDVPPRLLARRIIDHVREETGVTATAGIGTNLFLAKVALDIMAKHADDGIGVLDAVLFKRHIWFHRPLTDIWGIGPGIERRLAKRGIHDLAGVCAERPESLWRMFGKNAEFLIDHAWGLEPCTIDDIRSYRPRARSMHNGQVLMRDYSALEARTILREMIHESCMELVSHDLMCGSVGLHIGYSSAARESLSHGSASRSAGCAMGSARYAGGALGASINGQAETSADVLGSEVSMRAVSENASRSFLRVEPARDDKRLCGDRGLSHRGVPKGTSRDTALVQGLAVAGSAGGQRMLDHPTDSEHAIARVLLGMFDTQVDEAALIRRVNISLGDLRAARFVGRSLFDDTAVEVRERAVASAMVAVRKRFGNNALLRGTSLKSESNARERNCQIGGHHA